MQGEVLVPRPERSVVAVAPPGDEPGYWAGAPSAVEWDGVIYLAYRLRQPQGLGRGYAVGLASVSSVVSTGLSPDKLHIGSASRWRWRINGTCVAAANALVARPKRIAPLTWLRVAVSGLTAIVANLMSSFGPERRSLGQRVVSSVVIHLSVN